MTVTELETKGKSKTANDERDKQFDAFKKNNNIQSKKKVGHSQKENKKQESNSEQEKIIIPFEVLGFTPDRKILIWHDGYLMPFSVAQLREDELGLLMEYPKESEKSSVKNQIISEARERGIIEETDPIKMGVWRINGKWLIVSGKKAIEIYGKELKEVKHPVYDGKIIKFGKKKWIDIEKLKEKIGKVSLSEVYEKIRKLVSQWCWKEKDAIEFMTATVMLVVFQQAMIWRPWIYITGESDSGKSLFLDEVIEGLFRGLVKRADKTTEHAIYQAIGNTSRILRLDEFEKSRHIPAVMEALKLMSRGGEKNLGTPGDKEISFQVHHMPIIASIYKPATCLNDESQRNRIITFELTKPDERLPPKLWTEEEAENILTDIVAAVACEWNSIQEKADKIVEKTKQIKQEMDEKVNDRTIRNFMYISAILELSTKKDYSVPTWSKAEKKSDGESIVEEIVFSKIKHENKDFFVADLIDAALRRPGSVESSIDAKDAQNALRLHGLTTVHRNGWYLAIKPDLATTHLLKGSDKFKNVDITLPLERIHSERVLKKNATFGKNSSLASIQIPMDIVDVLRGYDVSQ